MVWATHLTLYVLHANTVLGGRILRARTDNAGIIAPFVANITVLRVVSALFGNDLALGVAEGVNRDGEADEVCILGDREMFNILQALSDRVILSRDLRRVAVAAATLLLGRALRKDEKGLGGRGRGASVSKAGQDFVVASASLHRTLREG